VLHTDRETEEESVMAVVMHLARHGYIDRGRIMDAEAASGALKAGS